MKGSTCPLAVPEPVDLTSSFRFAMRQLASGVCLVTHDEGEGRVGLMATSVSSLSVEPPTLVVCINRSASLYARLKRCDAFGVGVLGARHAEYAARFASRTGLKGSERFAEGAWAQTPAASVCSPTRRRFSSAGSKR